MKKLNCSYLTATLAVALGAVSAVPALAKENTVSLSLDRSLVEKSGDALSAVELSPLADLTLAWSQQQQQQQQQGQILTADGGGFVYGHRETGFDV